MSTRYIVLGLLAQQPMSGYDIKSSFSSLAWLVGSPSYGSLYPTLHGFLRDELVTVDIVPGDGKPSRKIYAITALGRQVLREWLNQATDSNLSAKAFLLRLIVAGNLSSDRLRDYLAHRRAQVVSGLADLEQTLARDGAEQNIGQYLVHDYGVMVARAELSWIDTTLERLS